MIEVTDSHHRFIIWFRSGDKALSAPSNSLFAFVIFVQWFHFTLHHTHAPRIRWTYILLLTINLKNELFNYCIMIFLIYFVDLIAFERKRKTSKLHPITSSYFYYFNFHIFVYSRDVIWWLSPWADGKQDFSFSIINLSIFAGSKLTSFRQTQHFIMWLTIGRKSHRHFLNSAQYSTFW